MYQEEIEKLKEKWPEESDWMTGGNKKGWNDVRDREVIGTWQVHDYVEFALAHKDVWRILPIGDGYATEVRFDIQLGRVKAVGYIDQIREYRDGSIAPADLKTGTKKPPSTMQLGTYAEACERLFNQRPEVGMFVKAGRPATKAKEPEHTADQMHSLNMWNTDFLTAMFTDMHRIEQLGIYLPNPQEGCERTCGVAEFCRIKGWGEGPKQYFDIRTRVKEPKQHEYTDEEIIALMEEMEASVADA